MIIRKKINCETIVVKDEKINEINKNIETYYGILNKDTDKASEMYCAIEKEIKDLIFNFITKEDCEITIETSFFDSEERCKLLKAKLKSDLDKLGNYNQDLNKILHILKLKNV